MLVNLKQIVLLYICIEILRTRIQQVKNLKKNLIQVENKKIKIKTTTKISNLCNSLVL